MTDFIEYVVSELKSKRLSKINALALIKQYSLHSSTKAQASIIHPLLHSNTSDLRQQSYTSTFSGEESFLKDHQVNGQKVLPGAAYLEMIRAAVEKAMPLQQESTILELSHVIWAQPIVIKQQKQVTIALFAKDEEIHDGKVDFEIYSIEIDAQGNQQEIIHCQGHAQFIPKQEYAKLDSDRLKAQMSQGKIEGSEVYMLYRKLGIQFGPSHQALTAIYKGDKQVLAAISLPAILNNTIDEYVLHPSLTDGALQAAIGLIVDFNNLPERPAQSLPFALESLCVLSACTNEMFAWVRYSQDSIHEGEITKMDIDLCDQEGNVCVKFRGFSSRVISKGSIEVEEQEKSVGMLLAAPEWELSTLDATSIANQLEYSQQYIVLCEFAGFDAKKVEALIPQSQCNKLSVAPKETISDRYSEVAFACFELIQKILKDKPQGKVLVQIVIASSNDSNEEKIFAGLTGLLKTATLENPQLTGQIIMVKQQITPEELVRHLQLDKTKPQDTTIKYSGDTRYVLRLKEIQQNQDDPKIVFKENGVYLITGGLGGLGVLFTKEILKQTRNAKIILTGRSSLTAKKQEVLDNLSAVSGQVVYKKLDIADLDQIRQLIITIQKDYKQLNGIIHSAGMILDNFIIKKTPTEFSQVIMPKVKGTFNLDQASLGIEMDFMVLFSSGASLTGNIGQSDYATANGFMDQFASYRNHLVALKKRSGKTISINWSLWQEGGMVMEHENQKLMQQSSGMYPMQTQTGMQAFYQSFILEHEQVLVAEGDILKLRSTLIANQTIQHSSPSPIISQKEESVFAEIDAKSLKEKTEDYLKKQFSGLLKLPSNKIDRLASLEKYGIDSILAMELTSQLEKTFGFLSKTLFFEYQTISELAEYFIKSHSDKMSAMFGSSVNKQEKSISTLPPKPQVIHQVEQLIVKHLDTKTLEEKTQDYLRKEFSTLLKLSTNKIDIKAPLEKYGIDSILAMELTSQLEKTFGFLSKTLFFEYQTIIELADYFIKSHSDKLASIFIIEDKNQKKLISTSLPEPILQIKTRAYPDRGVSRQRHDPSTTATSLYDSEPIAIIGLSGRYPEAINIEEYWGNLRDGKDCIIEVPKERWDWREYYTEDRTKSGYHYSKWGGFIAGVDEFDPRFFNISPREAAFIDPQERLFLQHSWMAIEDAGYTRARMQITNDQDIPGQVGVYVGVMYGEYQMFGAQASALGNRMGIGGSYASIANRVSYLLNLHGPSMTLDTMCSSSLTAIHLACQDLKLGRTGLAIAGGVNVSIHPNKYLVISAGQFISSNGQCQSFGEGGDGYIPGEGVGVVILKRLSEAQRDGNHIYGIIKGSAINHGGKTNGYSVPNPTAQASVISRALFESKIDARHITYIEAHGTGTKLGDPIEINSLSQAFQKHTQDTGFCLIGSSKSNIGHCESAAGIAGLTKVLLQMKYKQIVPSLHSKVLNPYIDFEKTPFVVNQTLKAWNQPVIDNKPQPRIAGLSSFGAGGSNAHIIIQEYISPTNKNHQITVSEQNNEVIIPLSARTEEQLKQKVRDLLNYIRTSLLIEQETQSTNPIDLVSIAYTLQVGREAMAERLGFIVNSVGQLANKLEACVNGESEIEGFYFGQVANNKGSISLLNEDDDFQETINKWVAQKKKSKLLDLWVNGLELDWNILYSEIKPMLISLPSYPFSKERYWVDLSKNRKIPTVGKATGAIHPLLHMNTSDLSQQSYSSVFSGDEFFLTDHQLNAEDGIKQKVFPATAYLEMVRVSVEQALVSKQESSLLQLNNIFWGQPFLVKGSKKINIALFSNDYNQVEYEIYSLENSLEVVHCIGQASYFLEPAPLRIDIENIKGQMGQKTIEAAGLYTLFSTIGLHYGPAHQGIISVLRGEKQLLAHLRLPTVVEVGKNEFSMHPCLIDSAVQASICLVADFNQRTSHPILPIALDSLCIVLECTKEMYAWVRYAQGSELSDKETKLDIDLCNLNGDVCVYLRGLSLKQITINDTHQENMELFAPEQGKLSHGVSMPQPTSYDVSLATNLPSQKINIAYSIEQFQHALRTSLADALYLQPNEIEIDKPFVDLGLDSIVGVEWVKEINKKFGLEISSTKIYDYSNIKELSLFLAKEHENLKVTSIQKSISISAQKVASNISLKDEGTSISIITDKPKSIKLSDSLKVANLSNAAVIKPQSIQLNDLQETLTFTNIDENKQQFVSLLSSKEIDIENTLTIKENLHHIDLSHLPVNQPEDTKESNASKQHKKLYTEDQVQQSLRISLADALYMQPNEIEIDKPFIDLGLDSIVGVEWVKEINKKFGLEISSTKIYDYPNIKELSSFLEKELQENQSNSGNETSMHSVTQEVTKVKSVIANNLETSSKDDSHLTLNTKTRQQLSYSKDQVQQSLRTSLADALYMQPNEIEIDKPFIDLGLDSIVGVEWVKEINKKFGLEISSTKIYDYSNIRELSSFLEKELEKYPVSVSVEQPSNAQVDFSFANKTSLLLLSSFPNLKRKVRSRQVDESNKGNSRDKIAIIGMSGKYPQAKNLQQYWDNLADGKNSITEIPSSRWDINQYYDPDHTKKGKMYCKWLGMVDDVDRFDPLFFQISPSEAESMDPQHRLFLQEGYKAFEDAGYSGKTLSNKKCGVYLGIMSNDYSYLLTKGSSSSVNITGNSFSIGAARIAYFLNLKGPAIPIDTACSSSLVAIHVACQGLLNHEIDMALAGGVSLYLIPEAYIGMCQAGMLSPQGQCKTFDDSANGFVPGEGVGTLVLKRLQDAERDNDFIYGVILGSGINQDGKTNGITAPSVNSQIELERDLYNRYKIDPESISYIETHGTGTKLGDPIELEALSTVFKEKTSKKNYCALGSVKSNIGHTSGAAGVASVQKVLLSMQHKTLVPSLNVKKETTIFDFKNSPFYISNETKSWDVNPGSLRRASVSSFGFSGTNAHLVIEEYPQQEKNHKTVTGNTQNVEFIIPLSARTSEQLKQKAIDLFDFIRKNKQSIDLMEIAYTLQMGRDEMKERLGFVVSTVDQLSEKLKSYIAGEQNIENVFQGQLLRDKDTLSMFGIDTDLQKIVVKWINDKKFAKLMELWVKGLEMDWNKLYSGNKPKRISLPTYPFAEESYWIKLPLDSSSTNQKSMAEIKVKASHEVEEEINKMHYYPSWKITALPTVSESSKKSLMDGPILILDTTDELYQAMKKNLELGLDSNLCILVKLDHSYQEIEPTIFTVNPEKEEHFYQLLENLKAKDQLPRQIIHQCLKPENLEKKEIIAQQLNYGVYALFNLCKSLMKQKIQTSLQILSLFSSTANITAPQNAALGGFFKTLTLENPKYSAKIVEIQSDLENMEISISEKISIILDEFRDEDWNKNEIRYKTKKEKQTNIRYVSELIPYTNVENKIAELPFKQNGVYIISGGLGGLGFIFSKYLVKTFQCNLVLFGRSALNGEQEVKLNQLKAYNKNILYLQADASKLEDMEAAVKTTKSQFSLINGVIHSAGVNKDSFILNKSKEEMESVLEPKIYGTINLDQATKGENLDVFIMFSSIAGAIGNLGQCDYAYGNHFLDSFAESRESLRKQQKRFGKTLSINWPYWEEGGMALSQNEMVLAKKQTGICPLPTKTGIQYCQEFLQSGLSQGIALYGISSKIKAYISKEVVKIDKNKPALTNYMDTTILLKKTETYLKALIGEEIKLSPDRIDSQEKFESFGIDSIIVSRINANLEKDLGQLSKTLFYEYSTIEELVVYLTREAKQTLIQFFNLEDSMTESDIQVIENTELEIQAEVDIMIKNEVSEPIAIIGVHGYFPQSEDLNKYWENLKQGKDLTDLVPASRWNYEEFYHQDPEKAAEGKIYCKWGGFLNDVDKFDPHFFNISQEEAKIMDPQERLFLKSVWATIEDAGYTKESLKMYHPKAKSADVGVFVGVTTNSYNLLATEEWSRGNIIPSAHPWSIANRISYLFDFQGPSMPIDTACSSSLVAIHLACESLKRKECQIAIAGGVNLYLHPSKYHSFCKRRMVSLDGKCHSFGAGDDGFVPGEGIGSILLKPLSKAIADKDHIYAVVAGSAFDHSGRSNGYSAPNPNSQANLIAQTLSKANINPETISYVEGHGTGTQLGDSLEIVALTNAFQKQTNKKQFCPIGSVKANIGHPESAAGIAGVAKILLQIKHRQLVPTIYSDEVNPNIEFNESPFYLQHKLTTWESSPDYPRRALINSFGAGGVNACLILEEYVKPKNIKESNEIGPYLFILSAKNEARLQEYVNLLLSYIGREKNVNLANLSYTLQVGREEMPQRLAIVISDRTELIDRLKDWRQQKPSANIYQGKLEAQKNGKKSSKKDDEGLLRNIFEVRDLAKLAEMWIVGNDVEWENLYPQNKPERMTLPTYPFAKERYWVSDTLIPEKKISSSQKNNQLHPLVSYNSSTLKDVCFSSLLSDREFYALEHQVNGEQIFPGSGFLEIASITGNIAGEQKICKIKDIVWAHPLSFKKGSQLVQTFLKPKGNATEYQITSLDDENERTIHSEGKLFFQNGVNHSAISEKIIPINMLKEKCSKPQNGIEFYNLFRKAGFNYGLGFQTINEFYVNDSYAISKLKIADHLKADFDQFILHPSLLDGALQTVAALLGRLEPTRPHLPFAIDELEIIRPLAQTCYAFVEFADTDLPTNKDIKKFNIQLLNEGGYVLVKLKNFYVRALANIESKEKLAYIA